MIPNFIGIITRRTNPQLKGAGGILTKCKRIFGKAFEAGKDFVWKEKEGKFVFYDKEGKQVSEVYLKHSEHEHSIEDYWQGIEASLICIDEATGYTLPMAQYIMSRMRNPSCPEVKAHLKMTCNPASDHFLRKWVEPYLKEDGTPDRSKDGLIRYFTFDNGDFIWGDSREEVSRITGCSIADVLSFTFISATVADNAVLQKVDPRYVSWLKGLKGVDRKRLLEGNWYAREEGVGFWKREWIHELEEAPPLSDFVKVVRAYDLAGSMPSDTNRNPDYTTSTKMGKKKTGEYVILEVTKTRVRFGEWESYILRNAVRDGTKVDIIIPQDPNAQAMANSKSMALRINEHGFHCTTKRATEGKLESFKPFSASSQLGVVHVVKDCGQDEWNKVFNTNEFFYNEFEAFTGKRVNTEAGHDDTVDSTSLAFLYLGSRVHMPTGFLHGIKSTDLSSNSPLLHIQR